MSGTVASTSKNKGPVVDPALCRCCRSKKKCRLLNNEYDWLGKKEVYSDMLMDCFGLLLSHLDEDPKDRGVCATCVGRLREASAFRQQVLQSEQAFINSWLENKDEIFVEVDTKVKIELDEPDSDTAGHLDDPNYPTAPKPSTHTEPECKAVKPKQEPKDPCAKVPRTSKRALLDRARAVQKKLDKMVDKQSASSSPKKAKLTPRDDIDRDHMVFSNTVTLVLYSYVCPFHNRTSNYYCYYCRGQFTNPDELREHTLTHESSLFEIMTESRKIPQIDITRIDCRLCPEKIDNLADFKNHITSVHKKLIYPVDNEFLKFRLTVDNIKCTECDSSFPYFDSLKKHMIEHFGTYICDQCGGCFLEQALLRTHMRKHSKVDVNYPCEICGKNLKSKYSKNLHVATVHEKRPTVNCFKCEESFLTHAQRTRHLIEAHGDKRTFPCKLCDKVYNRRKTLMEHNRQIHFKVYRHPCELCDKRFDLPSRLKEHMATHTGERNFRCEICGKCYPGVRSLSEHVRSHGKEKRFKCDICNDAFAQKVSLKNHMKTHHQNFGISNYG